MAWYAELLRQASPQGAGVELIRSRVEKLRKEQNQLKDDIDSAMSSRSETIAVLGNEIKQLSVLKGEI